MTTPQPIVARAYTVAEIDSMRESVTMLNWWGAIMLKNVDIEDRLRTYMVGNIDPDDLRNHAEADRAERLRLSAERIMARRAA